MTQDGGSCTDKPLSWPERISLIVCKNIGDDYHVKLLGFKYNVTQYKNL
jgi:hypothetical protein